MHRLFNNIIQASKQIGLTQSQTEQLCQALQAIQEKKSRWALSSILLWIGSIIAFSSMTWLYTSQLNNIQSLFVSIVYAALFFFLGFYFWHAKKLKIPGGVLSSLGIVMVPLIVYSLQHVMNWWLPPPFNHDNNFYIWISGDFVPMEICTLLIALPVFYFIRFPLITVLIYFTITFMSMDAIYLLTDPTPNRWTTYCIVAIIIGTLLNFLGWILYKKERKDFRFWSYLFGLFLISSGLASWDKQTEWGYLIYFLINSTFLLLSNFFHRKIFMLFGSLGIISYLAHLGYYFSNSIMFSYTLGAVGFTMIMLATVLQIFKKTTKGHSKIE